MPLAAAVDRPVLIVGGGIAGSALAIALARAGIPTEIVDVAGQAEGALIGLAGRAVDALEELGIFAPCALAGNPVGDGSVLTPSIFDGAGRPLPTPPLPAGVGARQPLALTIYRPLLAGILNDAAAKAGATRRTGLSVRALNHTDDHVDAVFTDGSVGRYSLVVGADGLRSKVRDLLLGPEAGPRYTGAMSLRWLVRNPPPGPSGTYCTPGASVTVAELPGGLIHVQTSADLPKVRIAQDRARTALREILGRFGAPLLTALRGRVSREEQIVCRPLDWLFVPPPWHRGRVVLVGDAAHVTTSHLAAGGGMALEDAVVLAQELLMPGTVPEALDRFGKRRADRVSHVVAMSIALLRLQQQAADARTVADLRSRALYALVEPY